MADYARAPDYARSARSHAEQARRLRVRRPLNDRVPVLGWHIEGEITSDRLYGPYPLRVHPDAPEYKQLLGFDAFLEDGDSVTITWVAYTPGVGSQDLVVEHVIDSGPAAANEVLLAVPFIVSSEDDEPAKAWIRPVFYDMAGTPVTPLCLFLIVQTVPV